MNFKNIKNTPLFNREKYRDLFKIIDLFKDKAEIFFVGGCVRDALLGFEIKDIDCAINCKPEETIKILDSQNIKYNNYSLNYGSITAILNNKNFEITSLREDIKTFGRQAKIKYTNDWKIDASRRDFTMNAIYISMEGEIYDPFDGISHLQNQSIIFIGNAEKRIKEDYLRILRFYRFLGIFPNPKYKKIDLEIIINNINNIRKYVSKEKIRIEILKMLKNPYCINSYSNIIFSKDSSKENILFQKIRNWWNEDSYDLGNDCIKSFKQEINKLNDSKK